MRNVQITCFSLVLIIIIDNNDNNDGNKNPDKVHIHRAKKTRCWFFLDECFSLPEVHLGIHICINNAREEGEVEKYSDWKILI